MTREVEFETAAVAAGEISGRFVSAEPCPVHQFRGFLAREGTEVIRLPPRSPNLNAFAERFVRSIKHECLSRMSFLGKASLRHAITQYMTHYHGERNHQGLDNALIAGAPQVDGVARIRRRPRLGGLLNYYCRAA